MKNFLKNNVALVIGLCIPLTLILVLIVSIYVPQYFFKPDQNFTYTITTTDYSPMPYGATATSTQQWYVYNVMTNTSKEISEAEGKVLLANSISSKTISEKGYTVSRGGGGGDGLFFSDGNDYNTIYINGHLISKKANINLTQNGSYGIDFKFLGWLKK